MKTPEIIEKLFENYKEKEKQSDWNEKNPSTKIVSISGIIGKLLYDIELKITASREDIVDESVGQNTCKYHDAECEVGYSKWSTDDESDLPNTDEYEEGLSLKVIAYEEGW